MRRLVVAPHADDEVLGLGGALARWAREGHETGVVVVTRGRPPLYTDPEEDRCREEARAAHARLGVSRVWFLDLPAAALDTVPQWELNRDLGEVFRTFAPQEAYLPFPGDVHRDHRLVFEAAMVAARPASPGFPGALFAYEVLSETHWNAPPLTPGFVPTAYLDITGHLDDKLAAMACYASQVKAPPHERSLEALRALAVHRGATVGLAAAEGLVALRLLL